MLKSAIRRFRACERGSMLPLVAVAMPMAIVAFAGALDISRMSSAGSALQDAVDAAALNAAKLAAADQTDDAVKAAAQSWLAANAASASKTLGTPTASTQITSRSPGLVKVTATSAVDLLFGGILGMNNLSVSRSATARAYNGDPVCLLVLNASSDDAWTMGGSSTVKAPNCVAHVNSTSAKAISSKGTSSATVKATYVVGNATNASAWTPAAKFGQPALADPLAAKITWPTAGACTYSKVSIGNKTETLNPGTYCGGLKVGSQGVATLNPGVYVIKDGELDIQAGASFKAASDTTIVLIGSTSTVSAQGGATIQIISPTTGPWAGIAIAVKPQASELSSTMGGGGETDIDGVVYMPTQKVDLGGGGALSASIKRRIFVVGRVVTSGNGGVHLYGDPKLVGEPSRAMLVY